MKVWLVGTSDCESCSVNYICATKELALKRLFEVRDELVAEYKRMDIFHKKSIKEFSNSYKMYEEMIMKLSGDNYEKWDNYPHETPYITEREVEE